MSTCVIVAECPSCTECFPPDDIGGPVWTCSRCGGSEIFDEGDRGRCSSCNVFMAKEAPASCPLCEEGIDPDDLDEIEKWETSDGTRERLVEAGMPEEIRSRFTSLGTTPYLSPDELLTLVEWAASR